MASLAALRIALQGLFPLTPIAVAVQGLLGEDVEQPQPELPQPQPGPGAWVQLAPRRSRGKPYTQRWPTVAPAQPLQPAHPVRRTRRKRDADLLLLG